jgi:hypothetical protein
LTGHSGTLSSGVVDLRDQREFHADKIAGRELKNALKLIAPNRFWATPILKAAFCDFEYVSSNVRSPLFCMSAAQYSAFLCAAMMPPTEAQGSDAAQPNAF